MKNIFVLIFAYLLIILCFCEKPVQEVKIGIIVLSYGDVTDTTSLNGASLALEEINTPESLKVGENRYRLKLVLKKIPNLSDAATAGALELITKDHVNVIIAPRLSSLAVPVVDVCERYKIPVLNTIATSNELGNNRKYSFLISFNDSIQGETMASFAYKRLSARKAALVYDIAQKYERDISKFFRGRFTALGGEITHNLAYTSDILDSVNCFIRIKQNEPDVVFLPDYGLGAERQAMLARKAGLKSIFISGDSWGVVARDTYLEAMENSFHIHHWHPEMSQKSLEFTKKYQQHYHKKPTSVTAMTYDAIMMLALALEKQKSATPEAIREGFSKLNNYEGVTGRISYHEANMPCKNILITTIKNGKSVVYEMVKQEYCNFED